MFKSLILFHRFLAEQSFYAIALSSFLALVFYVGRVLYGQNWNYGNLVWNLLLAWLPYLFSLFAMVVFRLYTRSWWIVLPLGGIWLVFFPNAPYIVTDFLHLDLRPPIPLWYDIIMLATYAWTGCFLALTSLRTMHFLVKHYLGWFAGWAFAVFALISAGLGIYLGRFGRFNSWDLLFRPTGILKGILLRLVNPFENLGFFGFTLMITAFLTICYLMFISIHPAGELEKQI
jgi:uncharacterized membrane protein